MRYMMLVCTDPAAEKYDPKEDNILDWVAEMDGRGVRVTGNRLVDPNRALTICKRGGKVLKTDGPFAETKEWIVGFDLLECASLEEAADVASRHPMARFGRIELRPFWQPE